MKSGKLDVSAQPS